MTIKEIFEAASEHGTVRYAMANEKAAQMMRHRCYRWRKSNGGFEDIIIRLDDNELIFEANAVKGELLDSDGNLILSGNMTTVPLEDELDSAADDLRKELFE